MSIWTTRNIFHFYTKPGFLIIQFSTFYQLIQKETGNPDIDMESEEADEIFDKYLFDYIYVDGTTTEAAAYICVEAETSKAPTVTMQNMKLYVTIFCHKQFMKVDTTKFKGMIGNRRDNLIRYVDKLLNGSDIFGIGKLSLEHAHTIPAPTGFSARELTYTVPEIRKRLK